MIIADEQLTPCRPRACIVARKSRQCTSASDSDTLSPSTVRLPLGSTPSAISSAHLTTNAVHADVFVTRNEKDIRHFAELPLTPLRELRVEQLHNTADLRTGHFQSASY